ncbi:MAG: hypothetical protein A2X46_04335 [Lentisphaerae bacterium GWF2_57_35]|nr:MAG: hypothetical protein A2X46_04335 [Lentisphaerae bacterium GWF2_57_35]
MFKRVKSYYNGLRNPFIRLLCGFLAVVFLFSVACSVRAEDSDQLLNQLIRNKQPGFVYDFADVVSAGDRNAISLLLNDLEARSSAQIKIVTLPSLEGGEIRDFANRLYEGWGIGQKGKDNGALMLMAQKERKIWIEVGYGLEGALPDAKTGRILDEYVMPSFRQNNVSGGLLKGAQALAATVAQEYGVKLEGTPPPVSGYEGKGRGRFSFLHLLFLIFLIVMFIRHPSLFFLFLGMALSGGRSSGGGFGGGGFRGGGFGGGMSGGGGAGRSW